MANKFAIERNILAAALACAAKKDARYYLNGVLIEPLASGFCAVATDGKILFAGQGRSGDTPTKPIIIPRDACEVALKTKQKVMICEEKDDGTYTLADSVLFKPVDGTFPNWRSVIPRAEGDPNPRFAPIAPGVLSTLAKSAKEIGIKDDHISPVIPDDLARTALFVQEDCLWAVAPLKVNSDAMENACRLPGWFTMRGTHNDH